MTSLNESIDQAICFLHEKFKRVDIDQLHFLLPKLSKILLEKRLRELNSIPECEGSSIFYVDKRMIRTVKRNEKLKPMFVKKSD